MFFGNFFRLTLLFVSALAVPADRRPKITGGTPADATQVPYIASIEFFGRFVCPAVIIAPRWVATSGTCSDLLAPEDIVVRTGATEYETAGHLWPVERLVLHPDFASGDDLSSDITLIELGLDIVQNTATKIISIAAAEPAAGASATVSGWGSVAAGSIMHRGLLTASLPIYARSQCTTHFDFNVTETRICTLKAGVGPCEFDEGDPLVVGGLLAGIKSWVLKEQCGDPDLPSLYTSLTNPSIRNFIKTTAGV